MSGWNAHERLLIVAGTFTGYTLLFVFNDWLFGSLTFGEEVNWIYLPSGLRLAFVLLFGACGAVGIGLASMLIAGMVYFQNDLMAAVVTGIISGLAPYLARHVFLTRLGVDRDLQQLTSGKLLGISLIFAVTSAVMHQFFFTWRGYTVNFVESSTVMALGDLAGTIIMLYIAKFALSRIRLLRR